VCQLPVGQREAVLAFYWQGLSHAETALELGIQPGAVKARLHQARENLAESLSHLIDETEEELVSSVDTAEYVDASILEIRSQSVGEFVRRAHVLTLKETRGERRLVIFVGPAEGNATVSLLESVEFPRPMTYQLCVSLIEATKATIREVRLTDFTVAYLAEIVLDTPSGTHHVDARPSDAINVALVAGAPIRISEPLFDKWANEIAHIPVSTLETTLGGSLQGD
jgi:hypothetical protein